MLHEYRSNAKKKPATSPELEKLKEEKLEADRKLADERRMLVEANRRLRDMEYKRKRGELVEQKASAEIVATATHPYTKGLLGCVPTLANRSATRLPVLRDFMSA